MVQKVQKQESNDIHSKALAVHESYNKRCCNISLHLATLAYIVTGPDEATVTLTCILHTLTCSEISVKVANKYRKVGHRQRLPLWWYIRIYLTTWEE